MRRTRREMEVAFHRFALARLDGRELEAAATEVGVSRATAYRFERRRVGTRLVSGLEDARVVATSSRAKVVGARERELVQLWLDGKDWREMGAALGMTWQGAQKATVRLWYSPRWNAIIDGLQPVPASKISIVRRCPECGYVQSFMNCCRCSRPGKRGRKVATAPAG